jgi:hypothetical protein
MKHRLRGAALSFSQEVERQMFHKLYLSGFLTRVGAREGIR